MDIREVTRPRRIVTGLNEEGKSYLARVEEVEPALTDYAIARSVSALDPTFRRPTDTGGGYFRIWASDVLPIPLPTDGKTPPIESRPTPEETPGALRAAYACPPPPGMGIAWPRSAGATPPGELHWHDSTDVFFVMSGERGQILDNGQEHILRAGDVQVQNATNHSHEQLSDEPSIMGYVVVGALRV